MDLGMYNGTATPHHHKCKATEFSKVMYAVESAVLKEAIPTLDELFIDEVVGVTTYIAGHGCTMFNEYMDDRYSNVRTKHMNKVHELMIDVAEEVRVRATAAANKVAKPYLDRLSYYQAISATAYLNAHILGIFATYEIYRGIKLSSIKGGRTHTTDNVEKSLSRMRKEVGLDD